MPRYLRNRGWTPVEVAIWLIVLGAMILIAILFFTDVVGSGPIIMASLVSAALALQRYRVETEQKKQNTAGHGD
jgi:Tfp pilus assembly protein PilE